MNSLQAAITLSVAGLLSIFMAFLVDLQSQMVFEEEVRTAAQTLADSLANQIRSGISAALLPEVDEFRLTIAMPAYSPPFDSFSYSIRLTNFDGVLALHVELYATRGKGSARATVYKAVYNVTHLQYGGRVVRIYADSNSPPPSGCVVGGLVNLTRRGCQAVWLMPDPRYTRQLVFRKT